MRTPNCHHQYHIILEGLDLKNSKVLYIWFPLKSLIGAFRHSALGQDVFGWTTPGFTSNFGNLSSSFVWSEVGIPIAFKRLPSWIDIETWSFHGWEETSSGRTFGVEGGHNPRPRFSLLEPCFWLCHWSSSEMAEDGNPLHLTWTLWACFSRSSSNPQI